MVTPCFEFRGFYHGVGWVLNPRVTTPCSTGQGSFPLFAVKFLSMSCASGVKVKTALFFSAALFDAAIAARIKR